MIIIRGLIGALSLILTSNIHAWVAERGYNHGGYYYNNGWASHGVVIGVPEGAYYGYGCSIIQRCDASGCFNERICR
ncbi:MAG: hypothetical protein CK424_06100 [Legionella sp.]|nr:MAG: hypothetical protein CK424_06100 [Legionella sp.]